MRYRITVALLLAIAFPAVAGEWLSGSWARSERRLEAAVEEARRVGDRAAEARLLARRAFLLLDRSSYHRFDPDGSRRAVDEARNAAEAAGDRRALADAIHALARWHYSRKLSGTGDWHAIDEQVGEALRIRQEIGDLAGLSDSWFYRGLVRQMQEDYGPAREAFEEALRLAQDPLARSFARRHLGYLDQVAGDLAAARAHYDASLRLRRAAGARVLVPFASNLLAEFELETNGDRERARRLLLRSARLARRTGSWRAANAAETKLAEQATATRSTDAAQKHARRALRAAQTYGEAAMVERAQEALRAAGR